MASSRINLAMARDRMVPNWLSTIHETLMTPHRAILLTGVLALSFLMIESLEQLAKIASVLQLYSYAALNVGCVVLRVAQPDWYEPSYRTPGFPVAQGLAALACLGIILYSDPFAQIAIVVLIVASLAWYAAWGRTRVEIEHAMPEFRAQWGEQGWGALTAPASEFAVELPEVLAPGERVINVDDARRVAVALANPAHETDLLQLGRYIATGREAGGHVAGLHLVDVPLQTPLRAAREQFTERPSVEQSIATLTERAEARRRTNGGRPLHETTIESVVDVAHDVFGGLINETRTQDADLLLMGWQGGFNVGRIYNSPIQRIIKNLQADLAVLKDRGFEDMDQILIPWGGGLHAQLGLEIALRVARTTGATVNLLRVVREDVDTEDEKAALAETVADLVGDDADVQYLVQTAESVTEGVDAAMAETDYDFVIIGASREWTLRQVLFGSIPDVVADRADCSVLMVRRYVPDTLSVRAVEGVKRLKESVGLTTSPEE
jgi:nucleotide-binding universal stress UspA family protein